MSGGRKDWSALSSLARQRTLEDEEEQERERRRRQRSLSSGADEAPRPSPSGGRPAADRLPSVEEAEGPESPPPAPGDGSEGVQAVARTRQERRQRRRAVEDAQTPARGQLEAGGGGDSPGPVQVQQQPLVPKREVEAPPRRRLSREQRGPWAREEESVAAREPGGGLKGVSGKPAASEPPVPEKPPAPAKPSAAERRLVSEKASVFEKSLRSETKLVPRKAAPSEEPPAREQPAAGGRPCTSSEQRARDLPEKTPPSSAEPGASDPPTRASHLPPITLQVKIPSKEEEADTFSPTRTTYSSSLQRSSPRTISFRMSPRKVSSEATLSRSASVRLPASTVKLGEKLERYHTAVQRSESVKSPGSPRTELFVAPVGVASKRHLFEKELVGQSRAEPASSRKEHLKLSGVVTSRLNLWISRTQESGEQDSQAPNQEARQETATTRRTQWGKKADSALDAEV
ncbi:ladinin-1 isoform X2 [Rousettus aegyptiacus]|uniref:Ladinin 1 n=1 Tax=Rousettus aegyptiacus TaxID=9407 RepID=A0A7J8BA09_ROUAE|nr:ladinin-1 isoform X2 [Rousettus aegyptiacus]KAF6395309.1 ladinin 1 [Rousettus aegyptiacus]